MRKLYFFVTLFLLFLVLGANAQSRKSWDFTKGVSDSSREMLDADDATWFKTISDGVSTAWTTNKSFDGELTANGEVVPEFAGLQFGDFAAANAVMYKGTNIRLQKNCSITLPVLSAGQKITIVAQSANGEATDRGFSLTNAQTADGETSVILLGNKVEGSPGVYTVVATVIADGVVKISTGLSGAPKSGIEIFSIIIDESDEFPFGTVDDLQVCRHDYVLVMDKWNNNGTQRPGKGRIFGDGLFLDVNGGAVSTDKGKSNPSERIYILDEELMEEFEDYRYEEAFAVKYADVGEHFNSMRIKNAEDVIAMKVIAGSKLIFLMEGNNRSGVNARIPKIATDAKLENVLNAAPEVDNEMVTAGYKYEWTATEDNTIYIGSYNGEAYIAVLIVEMPNTSRIWDFTKWSDATKSQILAAEDWTTAESASKNYITGDEIRWVLDPTVDANGDLVAGGAAIAEMKGLRHNSLGAYGMATAFDYQTTTDGNNWGPYESPSYLWITGTSSSIVVPNVKAGSTFKLGVESHKPGDKRGFKVVVNGTEVGATQTTADYTVLEYTIPESSDEYVDVVLTATKGVHLYSIEAEVKDGYPVHINDIEKVTLDGYLSDALVAEVNALTQVRELDLSGVTNTTLHIGGIASLESVVLPNTLTSYDGTLINCPNLLEVTLGNTLTIPYDAFSGSGSNTNMIVYAPAGTQTYYNGNVVVGGVADNIVLEDGKALSISREFTARRVSYTRMFGKTSYLHECGGWETIVLPFDVNTIESDTRGLLTPFHSGASGMKNFWLAGLTPSGFGHASRIQANIPYIICMPNSDEYISEYNITGAVTFSATDAIVHRTSEARVFSCPEFDFVPAYLTVERDADVYPINDDDYAGYHPGAVFVREMRGVRPFEAYAYRMFSASARNMFAIDNMNATGIMITGVADDTAVPVHFDLLGRPTSVSPKGLYLTRDKNGRYVKTTGNNK